MMCRWMYAKSAGVDKDDNMWLQEMFADYWQYGVEGFVYL